MRLKPILEHNLVEIYNSKNQSIHTTEFIIEKEGLYSIPQKIIEELLLHDLIETEKDENIFFLTTEGYNYVENIEKLKFEKKEVSNDVFEMSQIEKLLNSIDKNKFKKFVLLWLLTLAVFITIYLEINPVETEKEKINKIMDEEVKEKIREQTLKLIDSIKNN